MSIRLIHAAGDMFAPTVKRHALYAHVAGMHPDVFTFSEAAKDHAFIESLAGYDVAFASEVVIGWRTDTMHLAGRAQWAKVMDGGKLGPLGGRTRQRRGPSRYGLVVPLEEIKTGDQWDIGSHHAIAKADTAYLWRRSLRAQGFTNFAMLIRRAARPGAHQVETGDWNTKGPANLGLGFREVKTPGTFGRLRYDRIQTSPEVRATGVTTLAPVLDHRIVAVTLTASGQATAPAPAAHAAPSPAPAKPKPRTPWQIHSLTWRRRHPIRWRRIVRRWRRTHRSK